MNRINGKIEKLEKGKGRKSRRKVKKIQNDTESKIKKETHSNLRKIDKVEKIEKISSDSTKLKSKSKRKKSRIRKKTLGNLFEKRNGTIPLAKKQISEEKDIFTLRTSRDLRKASEILKGKESEVRKEPRKHGRRKLKKINRESKRPGKKNEMAAGADDTHERSRRGVPKEKIRKKPHSLPPLPRTPKSPITPTDSAEAQSLRRFIGSPPPTALINKESTGEIQPVVNSGKEKGDDSDIEVSAFLDEECTVYSPTQSLEQSHPKITLNKAPSSPSHEEEVLQENVIVSASPSGRSHASMSSLIQSTKSLSLNSSLSLPPKLLSYVAEDGSAVVQEWVPEDRITSAPPRRSSTPSIRDLPSPLQGVSPLEVTPQYARSKGSKPKLSPMPKR